LTFEENPFFVCCDDAVEKRSLSMTSEQSPRNLSTLLLLALIEFVRDPVAFLPLLALNKKMID
jgi:hypothetical protein